MEIQIRQQYDFMEKRKTKGPAEYMAAFDAAKEAIWLQDLAELGIIEEKTSLLHQDNQGEF